MNNAKQSWNVLSERTVLRASPWVTVSVQRIALPDGRVVDDYYRIQLRPFVLVVMPTTERRVLMLRHYRHGIGRECLGLPAGTLERGEAPLHCARRELLEETGWKAKRWRALGSFTPHSNYGCGQGYFFLATGGRQVAPPDSDDLEATDIVFLTRNECRRYIRKGQIASLSVVAALLLAFDSAPDAF